MNVLFIGSSSVGPRWIMDALKSKCHNAHGIFTGYEGISLGENAVPFFPPVKDKYLKDKGVGIVGITVDSLNVENALLISKNIKSNNPGIKIIWGGIHPSISPEECIGYPEIDYICMGEGEYPMLELCEALDKIKINGGHNEDTVIKNIWSKKDGSIFKNELRDYVDINTVEFDRSNIYYNGIFTGRGCAGNCTFCCSPYLKKTMESKGRYFRKRELKKVINEIKNMIKSNNQYLLSQLMRKDSLAGKARLLLEIYKYNTSPVRIKDDSFCLDKEWLYEFNSSFSKHFKRRGYICSARVNDITEKVVKSLKEGNCRMIILGFESGDEHYRNKILNKYVSDAEIYKAAKMLRDAGIPILGQWMIGMPGETPAQAVKSLKMSLEVGDI